MKTKQYSDPCSDYYLFTTGPFITIKYDMLIWIPLLFPRYQNKKTLAGAYESICVGGAPFVVTPLATLCPPP